MGTRYTVKEHTDRRGTKTEIYIDEHSNLFDIGIEPPNPDLESVEVRDLTFANLREIRDKINTILDYWDETGGK